MSMINGVNFGGWLVLEKWICDDVFIGTPAQDEGELRDYLSQDELAKRLKQHRDTFIVEQDVEKIADWGFNLIRLPIPYTLFGDANNSGCVKYVDQLFTWAARYGLKILLDLHTVPGGQNGLDNSGVSGLCTWHMDPKKVNWTIDLLENIAIRYGSNDNLYGIELLNEPTSKERFASLKQRIDAKYRSQVQQSDYIPTSFLIDFYTRCYERLNPYLSDNQKIVIHDGFRLSEWNSYLPKEKYPKLVIDTHMYLNFIWAELPENTSRYYIDFLFSKFWTDLKEASIYHPVLVGEWTSAHHQGDRDQMSDTMYKHYMTAITNLQKMAYETSAGWIYFNYKVKDPSRQNWDLTHVIQEGFFCCD